MSSRSARVLTGLLVVLVLIGTLIDFGSALVDVWLATRRGANLNL